MEYLAASFGKLFEGGSESDLIGKYDGIFVGQKFKWDCGLACCGMVLNWFEIESRMLYSSPESTRGSPLWSIELFCLLKRLGARCELFATSISVEHHGHIDWYKSHMDSDKVAVDSCLDLVEKNGWNDCIHLTQLTLEELKKHFSSGICCAIVLVHSPILSLDNSEILDRTQSFIGHYIFIISYDVDRDHFLYLNPSLSYAVEGRISSELLDLARSYPGSDHDTILCRRVSSS